MTVKKAVLVTALMLSGIVFMAAGLVNVDAGSTKANIITDGYGISELHD